MFKGTAREEMGGGVKNNTNLCKILLKRRVVERVAQWQLQRQIKSARSGEWDWDWAKRSLASSWNATRLSRRAFIYGEYLIFEFRISRLRRLPPLSSPSPSCNRAIDILTAVLGELQRQKSLHKYLLIYATKSTLAAHALHTHTHTQTAEEEGHRVFGSVLCISNRLYPIVARIAR